jgi:hypothetical protein
LVTTSALAAGLAAVAAPALEAPADSRTAEAIAVQVALERVCLPLLTGQALKPVAAASGLRRDDDGWFLSLPGGERLSVLPPGGSNPTVCTFSLTYPIDRPQPMLSLLKLWADDHQLAAASHGRPSRGPAEQRWIWSWRGTGPLGSTALVFDTEKTLDGRPVSGALDRATVLVSRTAPA